MPNHFSTIGLPIDSNEDVQRFAQEAFNTAEEIDTEVGRYLRWSSSDGAELWIQLDPENQVVGITPYFEGGSRFRASLTQAVANPDDTPLEGALYAWANPQSDDDPENGDYPFVFDAVDRACYSELEFPFQSELKLAAFAHELSAYASEAEYEQGTEEPRFAPESFIPSGLFNNSGEPTPPRPYAIFTGRILEHRRLTNPLSGGEYQWALVKTLGGVIDVLSDLELIQAPLQKDGILSGSFWLCGRVLQPRVTAKSGFLKKLFGE